MRKRYTIIYTDYIGNNMEVVQHARVLSDDIQKTLAKDKFMNAWLVFEGWPALHGEYAALDKLSLK